MLQGEKTKMVFEAVKKLTRKFQPRIGAIKDEQGKILTEASDIKERWLEYTWKFYEEVPQNINAKSF